MLRDLTTHVIGVDTHRDTHTFAIVESRTGEVIDVDTCAADRDGYDAVIAAADFVCDAGERVWALEGTGSYGAGLCAQLMACGEWVIEVERPHRRPRRDGRKTDEIDAVKAARDALGSDHWAAPRARGNREALRLVVGLRESAVRTRTRTINQLKAVIVSAPEDVRSKLRSTSSPAALRNACLHLRSKQGDDAEHRATVRSLHCLVRRIKVLNAEIKEHDDDINELTAEVCPELLEEFGVGPVTAAMLFIGWSHAGRCRNEAAFAMLSGTAPLEASSGRSNRHRLNPHGDRQLNRGLHVIVRARAKHDPRTRTYIANKQAHGKTKRETYRCLARYLARHFYRVMESAAREKSALRPT